MSGRAFINEAFVMFWGGLDGREGVFCVTKADYSEAQEMI